MKKIDLKMVTETALYIMTQYFCNRNTDPWFSHLCSDSVWIGNGEPLLLGKEAIIKHFSHLNMPTTNILDKEIYTKQLNNTDICVYGNMHMGTLNRKQYTVVRFSTIYRVTASGLRLIHQHLSYEYTPTITKNAHGIFVPKNIIQYLEKNQYQGKRITIKSGTQTLYVQPASILYVQSQRNKTELVCFDKIITCNIPIHKLLEILPEEFYPLHRCYLVNTKYILSIRRFEVVLQTNDTLPIPAAQYSRIKKELEHYL